MSKLVRIIRANQQQHHRRAENKKSLEPQQIILPAVTTHQGSSEVDASHAVEKIAMQARVLIIEGISGSGKDIFQTYLKRKLTSFDIYDYSEGEVLQSWNQLRIKGIPQLRLHFMKLFVKYMKDTLRREENAIFILNRFHLSAYAMTVAQRPNLQKYYYEIISFLRTMPVHVFLLKLDASEIEKRSLHPERSAAWEKFQEQIVKEEGFHDKSERYLWQQKLMLEAAGRQNIPYSIIQGFPEFQRQWITMKALRKVFSQGFLPSTTAAKTSAKKKSFTRSI